MPEENEVNKVQEEMISDILDGFVPPAAAAEVETTVEVGKDGNEGKERTEEETGGQVEAGTKPEEKAAEVVEPEKRVAEQVTETLEEKPAQQPLPEQPEVKESELEQARRELTEMRALLAEQAGRSRPEPAQPTAAQQTETGKQILRFLPDDKAYDDVTKDADSFNVLLTAVVNTAVERSLKLIPQVATNLVDNQMNLRTYVDEFYRANEDLLPYRKYVGYVTNEVASEHADWKLDQILQETETRSRTLLKLPKNTTEARQSAQNSPRTAQAQPAFVPGGQRGRRGTVATESLTGQDKQIADLLS